MFKRLKKLKFKTAPTLNDFVKKVDDIKQIKEYVAFLDKEPQRTDFISFDSDGFALNDNVPHFKGWKMSEEFSSDEDENGISKKVAVKDETFIYFETSEGVTILGKYQMSDKVTYNDLFIFFEGKLKLN